MFVAIEASMVGRLGKYNVVLFHEDGSVDRWWWRLLKHVHVEYALGLLYRVYSPGTSCGWIGGKPGSL